jgi:hypothetical protein
LTRRSSLLKTRMCCCCFIATYENLVWSTLIGHNEPKRSIFKSLKTWMRSGHPDPWDLLVTLRPAASLLVTLVARSMFLWRQNRHLPSKRSPDGPVLVVIHVKVPEKSQILLLGLGVGG